MDELDQLPGAREFTWHDGERVVVLREAALRDARAILARRSFDRYELLTTRRALAGAPLDLAGDAGAVHEVPAGGIPRVAAALIDRVSTPTLVALGGRRVLDAAKAIAAVRGGRVAAIPTTLSGAEMTRIHRLPEDRSAPHRIRPALVVADPAAMTGLEEPALRASAMNSLAHAAESLYTPRANPVGSLAALRGARLLGRALDQDPGERDAAELATGSLLCAFAMDGAGYALHHALCQTLVRVLGTPHAETNAAMLPHTLGAMRRRAPAAISALADALRTDPDGLPARVADLGGGPGRLSELGADGDRVDAAVEAVVARPQLADTPDPPAADEIRRLVESAW